MKKKGVRKLIVIRNSILRGIITERNIVTDLNEYVEKQLRGIMRFVIPMHL